MRTVGDRRDGVRFEVVGSFMGTFQATEASTRLIDLSEYGALFEAPLPLAVASVHSVCLSVDGLDDRDRSEDAPRQSRPERGR